MLFSVRLTHRQIKIYVHLQDKIQWSDRERELSYDSAYTWNLERNDPMKLFTK